MTCSYCQTAINPDSKICPHCQKKTIKGKRTPGTIRMVIGGLIALGGLSQALNPQESGHYVTDGAGASRLFEDSYRAGLGMQSRDEFKKSQSEAGVRSLAIGVALAGWGFRARRKHKIALTQLK